MMFRAILASLFLCAWAVSWGQVAEYKSIEGIVMDSVLNKVLPTTTVSLYSGEDSTLIKYSLTDHHGRFVLEKVPVETPLDIVISFIGYKTFSKKIVIPDGTDNLDLGRFYLTEAENIIDEVIVTTVPPVRMKGDTLEFNADAFKLDPNAVAEDLLRKLPGVIVWGDGSITVNGKEISELLVNGKPFFGGETKIATQNLPKNIIDKVQIYQENINPDNILDSISTMNIKLKKGKYRGAFGKISTAGGTKGRYDLEGNVNLFNRRMQAGIISTINNVNKRSDNIHTHIKNSTYKGTGASIEHQPNLTERGETNSSIHGYVFSYDFRPENERVENKINSDYLFNRGNTAINEDIFERIALSESNVQDRYNSIANRIYKESNNLNIQYKYDYGLLQATLKGALKVGKSENSLQRTDSTFNNDELRNSRKLSSFDASRTDELIFKGTLVKKRNLDISPRIPNEWVLSYSALHESAKDSSDRMQFYNSLYEDGANFNFNRNNQYLKDDTKHVLDFKFGNLADLIFHRGRNYNIHLISNAEIQTIDASNTVFERDENSHSSQINDSLSFEGIQRMNKFTNSISLNKRYLKMLSNRFQNTLEFGIDIRNQIFTQSNTSSQSFQNINRRYSRWAPTANVDYERNQFGQFSYRLSFELSTDDQYPAVGDMVPIVDSSGIYNIRVGNIGLRPQRLNEMSARFEYTNFRIKNTFNMAFGGNYTIGTDYISNSTYYDSDSKSFVSLINVDGYKRLNVDFSGNKSIKINSHSVQLLVRSDLSFSVIPSYVVTNSSNDRIRSLNTFNNNTFRMLYSLSDNFSLTFENEYNWFRSKSSDSGNILNSSSNISKFAFALNLLNGFSFRPNVAVFTNIFNGNRDSFSLLNAEIYYRTLKNKNLELKLSGYDLLNQNKSVINYGALNTIRRSSVNTLSRYYAVSLAYYLRKF